MTTFNTGNPLGSSSPKDLYDNAENLDNGINGTAPTWQDRRGVTRKSWNGIETDFQQFLADGSTIEFPTWAAASAAAGAGQIPLDRQVAVIGDEGTHLDPVTGADVPNSGRYVMTSAGLQWRSADVLSQKADKSELELVAGKYGPTVRGNPVEVWTDPEQNVCFALYPDGTAEHLSVRVGNHITVKGSDGEALASGKLNVEGIYTQYRADVSAQFPGAIMIDVDGFGRVGRITYGDGREVFPAGSTLTPVAFAMMPNGVGGENPNGGFTCTGLAKITSGPWTSCWLVANDGRSVEGSGVYECSVVVLSPDMSRVLREFTVFDKVTSPGSIQGVAWDESDDTFWFADQGANLVRHMDLSGVLLPDAINTGFIPNAVARIASEDALILPRYNTGTVDVYSCASGQLIRTISDIRADHDQAYYDASANALWYTAGANGSSGSVYAASMATGAQLRQFTLSGSQAIEGVHVDGQRLTVLNDGGFHTNAKPALSMACIYSLNI
ncbi:hypothetical protein [Stenotrophomonas sp. Sm10]|uniref:hypothetical protein n=1 Tax=Stenotrophomonas sp. Sm10 TaxID=3002754 RepID=UPI0027E47091|nr:hypothetical protein [Stenotrophomonas sp. Sm10]MDQ7310617.1 hypothetical protein [Stenotrophomonas sp. Sm10]